MMDLLNQIESNTQSVSDAGFEAEEGKSTTCS